MGSPDTSIPVERFSARWSGKLVPTVSGRYRLGASTDDGLRLSLDGKRLIDSWYDRGASLDFVTVELAAGRAYDLVMEYYENVGWSYASLVWQRDIGRDPRIAEAAALAKKSDVAVIVAGIQEGEGYDRSSLDLPGEQETLIREVAKSGTPTIVVLMAGSAVTVRPWADVAKAILDVWYPGQEGGTALAEVLFGEVNPGGRLPITFPQSVGQVPLFYAHKPTGRGNDYIEMSGKPQYPFGYGLSYTKFEYANLKITPERLKPGSDVEISFDVRNAGSRAGDEVVQLYLHDVVASVTRPVKELKAFRRVTLAPNERQTVTFTLDFKALSFLGRELRPVMEAGGIEVLIGASSDDIRAKGVLEVVN
jgi:beta-glucosidase